MGVETIVTCDRCGGTVDDGHCVYIDLALDIEGKQDTRERKNSIFCVPCGEIVWSSLLGALHVVAGRTA